MSEPRYTLAEARWLLAGQTCRRAGHDYQIILSGAGEPQGIICERCGSSWPVGAQNTGTEPK